MNYSRAHSEPNSLSPEAFYLAHRTELRRFVQRRVYQLDPSMTVVDDICSQAWIGFLQRWARNRAANTPVAILLVIADRRLKDWIARRNAVEVCADGDLIAEREQTVLIQRAGRDPESNSAAAIDLDRALSELSPVQRKVLLLHYVAGLSVVEVARLLARSRSGIYQLINTAILTLRDSPRLAFYRIDVQDPVEAILRARAMLANHPHASQVIMRMVIHRLAVFHRFPGPRGRTYPTCRRRHIWTPRTNAWRTSE
ncbi:hypothetical protein ALI144C_02485 [Actinosynnema sp. ALI-1.44]|uniref:RNA polymerase sigma factor n=1 Tax=Actinosynnema sp. ALI-1.44 TaxID=1933779 RepID=UPI00097C3145|nr:sigma-70 family RNA polymerase sigma factor [Actinosynnema sp. ALI-1.44]ONI90570.1 hypothetical protein ALI144C_02485 [Actinosynnema sp. ALI-1.44]